MIRRQPPVFSPLPLRALVRSVFSAGADSAMTLLATIRERFAAEEVLLCGSGTQALQLALQVAGDRLGGRSDLVALPAYTCYDVASAAIGANVRVVFYDIDPDTLVPDMESLTSALRREPAAVVIAPLFGYQPDWDALRALTTRHDVVLIEDAAQSFGSEWNGEPVGRLGDLSVLSFGRGKGWTAVQGGALLGTGRELTNLEASHTLGRPGVAASAGIFVKGVAQWTFGRPALYGLPNALPGLNLGETVFHPPVAPHGLSSFSARLALETLDAAGREADARRARASTMADRLRTEGGASVRVPRAHGRSMPGSLRLPVVVPPTARRHLVERGRPLGILPSYPRPLPELPPLKPHIVGEAPFPGATALAEGLVTLPTHSMLTESDLSRIFALVRTADG